MPTSAPLLDRLKDAYKEANKDVNSTSADEADKIIFSLQPEAIAEKAIDEVVSPGMTVIYDRERGSLTVCFSFSQGYRGMLVEWMDANNKVLGYTFAYGRNDPFVTATRRNRSHQIKKLPISYEIGSFLVRTENPMR